MLLLHLLHRLKLVLLCMPRPIRLYQYGRIFHQQFQLRQTGRGSGSVLNLLLEFPRMSCRLNSSASDLLISVLTNQGSALTIVIGSFWICWFLFPFSLSSHAQEGLFHLACPSDPVRLICSSGLTYFPYSANCWWQCGLSRVGSWLASPVLHACPARLASVRLSQHCLPARSSRTSLQARPAQLASPARLVHPAYAACSGHLASCLTGPPHHLALTQGLCLVVTGCLLRLRLLQGVTLLGSLLDTSLLTVILRIQLRFVQHDEEDHSVIKWLIE